MARGLLFACALCFAGLGMADTVPFTTIAFPNVSDPFYPPDPNLYVIKGSNTVPTGVNNNGVIVGQFSSDPGNYTLGPYGTLGFVYTGGNYYEIGSKFYADYHSSQQQHVYPTGINDAGNFVGNYLATDYFDTYAFLVTPPYLFTTTFVNDAPGFNPIIFPTLQPGFGSNYLVGINDSNQAIGTYNDQASGLSGGYLYSGGVFSLLDFTPLAINNLGQIVGQASNGHIVIDAQGQIRDLGLFPFMPKGFNDAGLIVGGDYLYQNGIFRQIQLAGESNVNINAINDHNEMVGTYTGSDGVQYGFAATPEPEFTGLLLCGLTLVFYLRRRSSVLS